MTRQTLFMGSTSRMSLRISRRCLIMSAARELLDVASKSGLKSTSGAELSIVRDVLRMSITEPRIWDLLRVEGFCRAASLLASVVEESSLRGL